MTHRRLLTTCCFGLLAMFAPGLVTAARADVVSMYNFGVTLNGPTVFEDTFNRVQTLAGGPGMVFPSGTTFSDGVTQGFYLVIGTVNETGAPPTVLDTAQGAHLTQSPPFFPSVKANIVTLLTGPSGSYALTQTNSFATSGLFNVAVPHTPGGFYQINLSDRVLSNNFLGDVISMAVVNCSPTAPTDAGCKSLAPGPYVQLIDANAVTGSIPTSIASVPLDTSNQQILLELTKPDPTSNTVDGYYEYFNNGTGSGLMQLGSYGGLFGPGPGTLDYTQAGFVQLAPVPEPSSLALLASSIPSVLGFVWFGRRKADGRRSKIGTRT